MAKTTTRRKLPYPEDTDAADVPLHVGNLAKALDNFAIDDQGALASRPAAGESGRYYYATDTAALYRDTGTGWVRVDDGGTRGKSIIATEQSTESTSFTALSTPDRCSNIEVPANGLVVVAFRAMVACTAESGRAAIAFSGGQARVSKEGAGSAEDIAAILKGDSLWRPLVSSPIGLVSPPTDLEVPGDATGRPTLLAAVGDLTSGFQSPEVEVGATKVSVAAGISNQIHGGIAVFRTSNASAENFNVEVQYKRVGGSGKVSAKDRKLWVWAQDFSA
ncbi:MAG TPA: hypothetical protein VNL97_05565 [Solirubrobacterales bacterium]|nr:hypothetical protein [Solirubrobacterales bacterium]